MTKKRVLFCLDSGTTAVKAAAFDDQGRMIATVERANGALRRNGAQVEQDMQITRDEALGVLRDCAAQVDATPMGLVITGQGDGLWPVDRAGEPVGHAMTWLDGQASGLVTQLGPALDAVQAVTGSRPTAASASVQLLWLQQNAHARFDRIAHALRLKEWLLLCLTGKIMGEPTAALPVWGRWQDGQMSPLVQEALGLRRGTELLPDFSAVGTCQAPLSPPAAAMTGLPVGLPVLLGPGDVQATLIGLGLGTRKDVRRGSIFGTSSIHASLQDDPKRMHAVPAGAMVQKFALGDGYLCFHPCFNGATLLHHLSQHFVDVPARTTPHYSGLILHPFFEPGGERAPWTDPNAKGAIIGITATTTADEIAWAGREALAFVACHSHTLMGGSGGTLSLGGGLAGDKDFAQFLATTMSCPVQRSPGGHAGLRGLAAIGAKYLLGANPEDLAEIWIGLPEETLLAQTSATADYAHRKYALFSDLIHATMPFWAAMSDLKTQAIKLMETRL